jgi:hypothetical protein
MKRLTMGLMATLMLAGCGQSGAGDGGETRTVTTTAPEVSFEPGESTGPAVKPQGPVQIAYKIIGTPIVGQPVAIDLQVKSSIGPQHITLTYRVNDTTAMQFPEAEPASVSIAPGNDEGPSRQQVRVIPLREGRIYLNVSAQVETKDGTLSTVSAIPIQVGAAPTPLQDNGELATDENGAAIRVLESGD